MINQVYRLVKPFQFTNDLEEISLQENELVVRPRYLSICAADQRYYRGNRDQKSLDEKLPMALIHESVGTILHDPTGTYKAGENVVLLPNIKTKETLDYRENYDRSSYFRSSSADGFMQSLVVANKRDVIPLGKIDLLSAAMLELMSVVFNAIDTFEKSNPLNVNTIGVWGNGNLGYLASYILKHKFPKAKIYIAGRNEEKMAYFNFVDKKYNIKNLPKDFKVDHAFECVGGVGTSPAINQIIDYIQPQGRLMMLGVSEDPVAINTRMVLEKGLHLLGASRSSHEDFYNAVQFLAAKKEHQRNVKRIISEVISVTNIDDLNRAFNTDVNNLFKTVMDWNI